LSARTEVFGEQGMKSGLDKMLVTGQGIGNPLLLHDRKGNRILENKR
jgi:hypothetical protein